MSEKDVDRLKRRGFCYYLYAACLDELERYDECEKDINKYLSYVSGYLSYSLYDILKGIGQKDINVDDLSCYIEFDEMP